MSNEKPPVKILAIMPTTAVNINVPALKNCSTPATSGLNTVCSAFGLNPI